MMTAAREGKPDDIVVFWIIRDSECSECGCELFKGRFLRLEEDRPLCLSCADLDHLVFLPSGNTALTRRAGKYSTLRAVVVRFSRARKRYERQGILVEEAALARAEQECLEDADARALARERAAERRAAAESKYVAEFARKIEELFPGCPAGERTQIAIHACLVGSGRIGRSEDAKALADSAIELAVRAHVRHVHTPYDEILARGADRFDARERVRDRVEAVLRGWRRRG